MFQARNPIPGQSSAVRKSRVDARPSMLPKPRRTGSTDHRSSSADPPRATFVARLSREASATKLPVNKKRSKSHQSESKYGPAMTPLHTTYDPRRTTTAMGSRLPNSESKSALTMATPVRQCSQTPQRTPSGSRSKPSWEQSLDRALAFITVKDHRQLSNAVWQRAELARVSEALAVRAAASGNCMALIRPLTIARFLEITGHLLAAVYRRDLKLTTLNYMTKLPHLTKRLLYPGKMSKSWLIAVNTLQAFPHALALIAYLLDLVTHIENPIQDELLYVLKDEVSCLRRDYLHKCWQRFQQPECQFEDLDEEYLQKLKVLLGDDEEKIAELKHIIKKYEEELNDEEEAAARAEMARREERLAALKTAVKAKRMAWRDRVSRAEEERSRHVQLTEELRHVELEIERVNADNHRLREEIAQQPMSVSERLKLLEQVDIGFRVNDSKRALAAQLTKMVQNKDMELAQWHKKALESCAEYKKKLIEVTGKFPDLSAFSIDESDLMSAACAEKIATYASALRERSAALAREYAERTASRTAKKQQTECSLEETKRRIAELKLLIEREKQDMEKVITKERIDAATWSTEEAEMKRQLESIHTSHEERVKADAELEYWRKQEQSWQSKLAQLQTYIVNQKQEAARTLQAAKEKRIKLVLAELREWNAKLLK